MNQPVAFMLHGFLGVGKTTLARQLEREHRAIRFSHDAWMARLYGSDPPAAEFEACAARVSEQMEQVWSRCLELGQTVVLDSGFWSKVERQRVRTLVTASGGRALLYRLTCPDDVARARIAARNQDLGGSLHITLETYEILKARFEPLDDDEPFVDWP